MDIKEKITKLRLEKGWSLSKLARTAGISENAVYNWYNEKNFTPSRDAIEDVCAAFDISLAEFYSDIEVDKLTDKETKLLEIFRNLSEKQKDSVITVAQSFID